MKDKDGIQLGPSDALNKALRIPTRQDVAGFFDKAAEPVTQEKRCPQCNRPMVGSRDFKEQKNFWQCVGCGYRLPRRG